MDDDDDVDFHFAGSEIGGVPQAAESRWNYDNYFPLHAVEVEELGLHHAYMGK